MKKCLLLFLMVVVYTLAAKAQLSCDTSSQEDGYSTLVVYKCWHWNAYEVIHWSGDVVFVNNLPTHYNITLYEDGMNYQLSVFLFIPQQLPGIDIGFIPDVSSGSASGTAPGGINVVHPFGDIDLSQCAFGPCSFEIDVELSPE